MARIARVVAPGFPHHVIQRGNRRQQTFFSDDDYRVYLDLMSEWCGRSGVTVWAYCLMPNHVHLVVVPKGEDGLRRAVGDAHRRYTLHVNARESWTRHLWQGRFASVALNERIGIEISMVSPFFFESPIETLSKGGKRVLSS